MKRSRLFESGGIAPHVLIGGYVKSFPSGHHRIIKQAFIPSRHKSATIKKPAYPTLLRERRSSDRRRFHSARKSPNAFAPSSLVNGSSFCGGEAEGSGISADPAEDNESSIASVQREMSLLSASRERAKFISLQIFYASLKR